MDIFVCLFVCLLACLLAFEVRGGSVMRGRSVRESVAAAQ